MGLSLRKWRRAPEATDASLLMEASDQPSALPTTERFHCMYDDYRNDVLRYCRYRLPTEQDAEDATQEIFLHAYQALSGWTAQGAGERAWIFTIAHNEVVDRQRSSQRKPQTPLDSATWLHDRTPTPEQYAIASGELETALGLLDQLSDDQRRVMELRLVGLTGSEIARVLDKQHATVRKLQERALQRLTELRLAKAGGGEPV